MIKILYLWVCGILFLCSCMSDEKDLSKIQELQTRLIATEAQLLNVRSELSKCGNEKDSIAHLQNKQLLADSLTLVQKN